MRQTEITQKEKIRTSNIKFCQIKSLQKKPFIQNFITKYFFKILINNYGVIIRISKLNIKNKIFKHNI
jgi:hypothetical protein